MCTKSGPRSLFLFHMHILPQLIIRSEFVPPLLNSSLSGRARVNRKWAAAAASDCVPICPSVSLSQAVLARGVARGPRWSPVRAQRDQGLRFRPRRRIYWRQQDPGRSPGNGTENPAGRRTCPCPCEWKQLSGQPAAHPVSSWAVFREDNKDLNVISPGCGLFVPDRNNYSFFLFCSVERSCHTGVKTLGFFFSHPFTPDIQSVCNKNAF